MKMSLPANADWSRLRPLLRDSLPPPDAAEVGLELGGVTRERTRQLEARAMKRLRECAGVGTTSSIESRRTR